MILYLDTSVVVSALTNEAATLRVHDWLGRQTSDDLATSDWVAAEFSSALSIKLRSGHIGEVRRTESLHAFSQLYDSVFTVLPILPAHIKRAARMVEHHQTGLRAADALHLAVCLDHAVTLCTLEHDRFRLTSTAINMLAKIKS